MRRFCGGALAAGLLTVVGCGSSGSSQLSASDFRTQATAICAAANMVQDGLKKPTTAAEVQPFLEAGYAAAEGELDQLRKLSPPSELKVGFDAALSLVQKRDAKIKGVIDELKIRQNPDVAVSAAQGEITALNAQADAKARQLGLSACGKNDEPAATTVPAARFATDLQGVGTALTKFGSSMSSVATASDLGAKADELSLEVDNVDAALSKMSGYRLSEPALEGKRSRIVEKGRPFLSVLHEIVSQSRAGNVQGIQDLLPKLQATSTEFTKAVVS